MEQNCLLHKKEFDNLCKIEKNALAAWKRENGKKGNRENGAQQSKESNEDHRENKQYSD